MRETPIFSNWQGFAIKKNEGAIHVRNFFGYETRNESTLKLVRNAISIYGVKDFDWIVINTGDFDISNLNDSKNLCIMDDKKEIYPLLAYSTSTKSFANTLPDFVFDHWRQTGLVDYELTRNNLKKFDFSKASTSCLGWRGALTHPSRKTLVEFDDKVKFDCELITWNRADPNNLSATNFMTFEEQVSKWRFLIDMRGVGYSGRLKLLLSSRRVVFLQERIYEEYFFKYLKPWIHYVPVKEDLTDLRKNYEILLSKSEIEDEILNNTSEFSQSYLTRDFAIFKIAKILQDL